MNDKQRIREEKAQHRLRKHQAQLVKLSQDHVNVGCVIHGAAYEWLYVERLHSMLSRNLSIPITMHVWTEADRPVPAPFVKHALEEWPEAAGPKRAWWYKMQMFDPNHYAGDLLYFDLDVVICKSIDWILHADTKYFWSIRDFKYLWRPRHIGINSSIMWWNTIKFNYIWDQFRSRGPAAMIKTYQGDQDFLSEVIDTNYRRYFDTTRIRSWRWEAFDGGYDFNRRCWRTPGRGTNVDGTDVLVFHGSPKPKEISDTTVANLWC